MSISSRGFLAAGLTAAVVGSIGVVSMLKAGAEETPQPPAATASADDQPADSIEPLTPPTGLLPWGEKPHPLKLGDADDSSAELAAAGESAAKVDESATPPEEFAPKGRIYPNGAVLQQETNVAPPLPPPAAEPVMSKAAQAVYYYYYSIGKQSAETEGASATITVAKPTLATGDSHSLAEIAVQSSDGKQVIEVGWNVDRGLYPDGDAHLFVFSWVNGSPGCYNLVCSDGSPSGFVPAKPDVGKEAPPRPGAKIAIGTANFGIKQTAGAWWIAYKSDWIGAFPNERWNNSFTRTGLVQFFGEVAASSTTPCTDMGNGVASDDATAARFTNAGYINGPTVVLDVRATSTLYGAEKLTDRTFRFGGPGAC